MQIANCANIHWHWRSQPRRVLLLKHFLRRLQKTVWECAGILTAFGAITGLWTICKWTWSQTQQRANSHYRMRKLLFRAANGQRRFVQMSLTTKHISCNMTVKRRCLRIGPTSTFPTCTATKWTRMKQWMQPNCQHAAATCCVGASSTFDILMFSSKQKRHQKTNITCWLVLLCSLTAVYIKHVNDHHHLNPMPPQPLQPSVPPP